MAPPSRTPLLQSIEIFIYCYKLALHYGFNEEHFLKNIVNMLGFFSLLVAIHPKSMHP